MNKLKIQFLYKNFFKQIYGLWSWINADFTSLVESWKPILWPYKYTFTIPSYKHLEALYRMRQSELRYYQQVFRNIALKYRNFKFKIFEHFLKVTGSHIFDSWLIFDVDSDGQVQISKFKLFRFHRNKVWIGPLHKEGFIFEFE